MNASKVMQNQHQLLDAPWARAGALRMYEAQLAALHDIVGYAADLCLRAYRSAPDTPEDAAVVACVFRQLVAAGDAGAALLSLGAAYMARLPTRSALEAEMSLEWILKRDKVQRGRQFIVGSFRRHREWQLRGEKGTPAHEEFARMWKLAFGDDAPSHPIGPGLAAADADQIERLLNRDDFREINREFEARRVKDGREPEWFSPGPTGVPSYRAMAAEVGAEFSLVFFMFFDSLSDAVHGRDTVKHAGLHDGSGRLEFIRDPCGIPAVYQPLVGALLRGIRLVVTTYRPDELPAYEARHSAWLPQLEIEECPDGMGPAS